MPRVVFYHIEKCAGMTIRSILLDYARHDTVVITQNFRPCLRSYQLVPISQFDALSRMQVMHDVRCRIDWKAVLPNVYSVCFFRDPIDRLFSHWLMICAWPDEEASRSDQNFASREIARSGFHEYLISDDHQLFSARWNYMTRQLLHGHPDLRRRWNRMEGIFNPAVATEIIDTALKNLERLDFIGIVEDFDVSVDLLAFELGRPPISNVPTQNVRGRGGYLAKIDRATLAAAEACVQLDRIVYARARRIYEEKLQRARDQAGGDLRAATEARYLLQLATPAAWRLVSMGDVLNGTGWQQLEVNGDKISRWIGPTAEASLDVVVRKDRDLFVRIRCTGFMSPSQLDGFGLRADGTPVELTTWVYDGQFRYYDAIIPRRLLNSANFLRLNFSCRHVYRASDPNDPRMLGLEITDVEVGPVTGFRLGEPGTPDP